MKYRNVKKGFTLIELILALGVGVMISFIKFQDMRNEQNLIMASAAGEQIQRVGSAVNNYISLRYDKISTLTSSTSQTSDPGPRTCSGSSCTITLQTLKNEGILPDSYTDSNVFRSPYSIVISRSGTSPNYVIDGLVTTTAAWIDAGNIRYDLLGYAMQKAGIDSGVTKTTSQATGYNGSWSEQSSDFNNINKPGQLVFRAGYNASLYSAYLRRDGTLPMTGNLNMGANDINNAKNITASGTGNFGGNVTSGGTVTAAGEVVAHNGNGDTISMGGDNAGGVNADYEIRLGTAKPLVIFSPNAANYTTVLSVNRNLLVQQRMSTNGLDPNDLPTGWGGGVRTFDLFAGGTIAIKRLGASSNDDWGFVAGSNGDVIASNSITSKGVINATGNITSNASVVAHNGYGDAITMGGDAAGNDYEIALSNPNRGLTVWSPNGAVNLQVSGTTSTSGRITAGEFIQVNGVGVAGNGCSPNGLFGREGDGSIISCVNGVWKKGAALTRGACYWTGNPTGRDFTPKMCNVGEYVAGFRFNGHQDSESAYTVACCAL